jgi:hypothetical protein
VLDGVLGGASIFEVCRDEEKKRNDFTYQVLTIELDDRKDILTIETKIMCQIFRSSQKPQGKPVRRSKQNDTKNRRFSKTALKKIRAKINAFGNAIHNLYYRWSYNSSSSIFIDKYSSSSLNSLYDSPFAVSVSGIPKLSMRPLCSNT